MEDKILNEWLERKKQERQRSREAMRDCNDYTLDRILEECKRGGNTAKQTMVEEIIRERRLKASQQLTVCSI